QMTNSTTIIDTIVLKGGHALVHTAEDLDYFMLDYDDVILLVVERTAYMVDDRPLLFLSSFFFSSRRRHTRLQGDWSSDVCSSDLYMRPFSRPRWASPG